MNILSIYHYAQSIFSKIIEPYISSIITKSIIENKNEASVSLSEEMNSLIDSCEDEELIKEIHYSHMEIVKNTDILQIYFDYIFKLINDFCHKNKIICNYQLENDSFNLKW